MTSRILTIQHAFSLKSLVAVLCRTTIFGFLLASGPAVVAFPGCSGSGNAALPSPVITTPKEPAPVPSAPASAGSVKNTLCGLAGDSLLTLSPSFDMIAAGSDTTPYAFPAPSQWVDSVMRGMTLRQKVAQLVIPFTFSDVSGAKWEALKNMVTDLEVGGVIISRGTVDQAARLTHALQAAAKVPLLITADFESGLGYRLDGATQFPSMMALGAANDPDLAYDMGRAVAAEARAVGVQQNYAPVCDVNNNPGNPIINTRSIGAMPANVARMAEAYARGMQDGGLVATAKHFPGHGDTDVDSHNSLPVLAHPLARIDSIELRPFRALIDAGVLSVMLGHLAVPALDRDSTRPASLSRPVTDSVLRHVLGFRGLVVTDALNMGALPKARNGKSCVTMALLAGSDMILMPDNPAAAVDEVVRNVKNGTVPAKLVDRAVARVLAYKDWLGLARDSTRWPVPRDTIGASGHRLLAGRIAGRAVTLVRNDSGLLPVRRSAEKRVASICLMPGTVMPAVDTYRAELREFFGGCPVVEVPRSLSRAQTAAVRDSMEDADVVLVASFVRAHEGSGVIGISKQQKELVESLSRDGAEVVLLSYGSPYVVASLPCAGAAVCAYGDDDVSVRASLGVVRGDIEPTGVLPVQIPGVADAGFGLRYPVPVDAEEARYARAFAPVDSLVMTQIYRKAFPGAQLIIGRGGRILHKRNFGNLTYAPLSPLVDDGTMYDIASMSKVLVTTTAVMMLYEEGRLDLDARVSSILPAFGRNGKERITIRNLLVHNSGLPAFRAYYTFCSDAAEALDTILGEPLDYPTGTRTVYSDLGMIVLGKVIEQISGKPLDVFARERVFGPLGMAHSMYNPADSLKRFAAPTELDTVWRKRVVQGAVHDETAALLGGVAGHAGVFSTASDIARFARMMLNGGTLDGRRLLRESTIDMFTRRQDRGSSRALGWDMRSSQGSSAGRYFSMRSFGHTGFTGTSIWIDPEAGLFVVFLTNRVHPSRQNRKLIEFRPVLHDAIRAALSSGGN
jgi:beta-glucosidase-like glycosyl hydrolase/CubicO group peptidase (beta-lactamase class C family)